MDCIYVWADGTWCVNGELHEMSHMSDDYITVPVGDDESYDAAAERHFTEEYAREGLRLDAQDAAYMAEAEQYYGCAWK